MRFLSFMKSVRVWATAGSCSGKGWLMRLGRASLPQLSLRARLDSVSERFPDAAPGSLDCGYLSSSRHEQNVPSRRYFTPLHRPLSPPPPNSLPGLIGNRETSWRV